MNKAAPKRIYSFQHDKKGADLLVP
jgi:hypothetical protein